MQRFQREAQAAASLVHANIVQIYEVGCVDGRALHRPGVRAGPEPARVDRPARPARPAALACRSCGKWPRRWPRRPSRASSTATSSRRTSCSPGRRGESGRLRPGPRGRRRRPLNLTQIGITMGTPLYMSPEQVEGKPLDPRSDIYSFGVTCYHMLAGSRRSAARRPWAWPCSTSSAAAADSTSAARPAARAVPHRPQDAGQESRRAASPRPATCSANCAHWRSMALRRTGRTTLTCECRTVRPRRRCAHEATARLASLMKTESLAQPNRRMA